MRELKAVVLIITLVTGIFGVIITDTSLKKEKLTSGEQMVYSEGSVTELPMPSGITVPPSEFVAPPVDEIQPEIGEGGVPGVETDKIEIPEIIVADFDDEEDHLPNKVPDKGTVTIDKEEPIPTVTPDSNQSLENNQLTEKIVKIGIDVSKWNGDIDWTKVAESGVEYAIIRAGYRGSSTGKIKADPRFYDNIEGAIANGIEVGVYFYSQAINETEAIQEAAWICELIKNYNITYPVAYDLEEVTYGRIKDCSYRQFNNNARAFLDYVNAKGYRGSLYSCKSYLEDLWDGSMFTNDHIWLAHYTKNTSYSGRYDMWQYTDSGKVDGIDTSVDLNYAYFYEKVVTVTEAPVPTEIVPSEAVTPVPTPEISTGAENPELTVSITPSAEPTEPTPTGSGTETIPGGSITEGTQNISFTPVDEQCVVLLSEGSLNVRDGASDTAGVIGSLENRQEVRRLGISENGWSEIEYGGGKAYVSSAYLDKKL